MFVKICGMTSEADARLAVRYGADAVGLIFYPGSPRAVSVPVAAQIVASLPPFVDPVGVFVNPTVAEVRRVAATLGLKTVQLHGQAAPDLVGQLAEFNVVRAVGLKGPGDVEAALAYLKRCQGCGRLPAALLVDAQRPGLYGGTGQQAPWDLARTLVQQSAVSVVLAGGLRPGNVADAIRAVRPWGVDVASGVEIAPGRKDSYKLRRFMQAVRGADAGQP